MPNRYRRITLTKQCRMPPTKKTTSLASDIYTPDTRENQRNSPDRESWMIPWARQIITKGGGLHPSPFRRVFRPSGPSRPQRLRCSGPGMCFLHWFSALHKPRLREMTGQVVVLHGPLCSCTSLLYGGSDTRAWYRRGLGRPPKSPQEALRGLSRGFRGPPGSLRDLPQTKAKNLET